jgi:hypothetical protein
MAGVPDAGRPPPLPPSPFPDDLVARCSTAFVAATVRSERAVLEVHRTHLRIETPVVTEVTSYSRRIPCGDLVLSFEQITSIRPVGLATAIIELPRGGAIALTGRNVRATLQHAAHEVTIEPRRFRPFFVSYWLIHHRDGRIEDARRLP